MSIYRVYGGDDGKTELCTVECEKVEILESGTLLLADIVRDERGLTQIEFLRVIAPGAWSQCVKAPPDVTDLIDAFRWPSEPDA